MKIWVIGRNYPTKHNNRQGSFELDQAKLLKSTGENEVAYLSVVFHPIKKIKKWGYCRFDAGGMNVYCYSFFWALERMNIHNEKIQGLVWRNFLNRVAQETGIPDIIHVHYPGMITIPKVVLEYKTRGSKIIVTEHWTRVLNDSINQFQKKNLSEYIQMSDEVISVGQPLKESIIRITGTKRKIEVIPNFISKHFTLPNINNKRDTYEFIVVGRLAADKQIDKVVLAFSKAFAGKEQMKLVIVGGGKEKKRIERTIQKERIEKQVKLVGILSHEETADKIKEADALVCFSRIETFGVPIIEAWACGKPVIASNSLGFAEYWNENLGYIVDYRNIEELSDAMSKLYKNREKYNAEAISRYAIKSFGEESVYNKLMAIYNR